MLLCSLSSFSIQALLLLLCKRSLPWIRLDDLSWQAWNTHLNMSTAQPSLKGKHPMGSRWRLYLVSWACNVTISHRQAAHHQKVC